MATRQDIEARAAELVREEPNISTLGLTKRLVSEFAGVEWKGTLPATALLAVNRGIDWEKIVKIILLIIEVIRQVRANNPKKG